MHQEGQRPRGSNSDRAGIHTEESLNARYQRDDNAMRTRCNAREETVARNETSRTQNRPRVQNDARYPFKKDYHQKVSIRRSTFTPYGVVFVWNMGPVDTKTGRNNVKRHGKFQLHDRSRCNCKPKPKRRKKRLGKVTTKRPKRELPCDYGDNVLRGTEGVHCKDDKPSQKGDKREPLHLTKNGETRNVPCAQASPFLSTLSVATQVSEKERKRHKTGAWARRAAPGR